MYRVELKRLDYSIGQAARYFLRNDGMRLVPFQRLWLNGKSHRSLVCAADSVQVTHVYLADFLQQPFRGSLNVLSEHIPMVFEWNNSQSTHRRSFTCK